MGPPNESAVEGSSYSRRQSGGSAAAESSSAAASDHAVRDNLFTSSSAASGQSVSRLRAGESLRAIRQTAQDLYLFKDNVSGRSALVYGQTAGGVPQRDPRHGNRNPHTARDREREKNTKPRDTTPSKEDRSRKHHHSHHRTAEQSSPEQRRSPKPSRWPSTQIACHDCGRAASPEWRPGPNGPGTLCNVCGLVYAKRESHRRDRAATARDMHSRQ